MYVWPRLARYIRYIQVKHLLFIRSILKMEIHEVVRLIFIKRFNTFNEDIAKAEENKFMSPIFGM